jgi:hypothetical protein
MHETFLSEIQKGRDQAEDQGVGGNVVKDIEFILGK